ncbi:MAG TPA: hypothetical protein VLV83_05905 [Acidobacteriota bacterium]|nr:hypothetical protein [Acidobacteriota bacterium]
MREFSGYTGPETVWGQWSPDGQEVVRDQSRKYSVAVPQARVKELLRLIRRVGNTFDQRAMYVEIAGYAEVIKVRPEDGFLEV